MIFKPEMVANFAKGTALLGSGGGQNPELLANLVSEELKKSNGVHIIDVHSLSDDALVVPVEYMGAPNPDGALSLDGRDLEALMSKVSAYFSRPIDALLTGEIGGANGLVGLLIAARTGLPLIDGDAVGRALPKLSMNTPSLFGIKATPAFLAADNGETIIEIETHNVSSLEKICRSLSRCFGGNAAFIFNVMNGLEAKKAIAHNTISQALMLGEKFNRGETIGELLGRGTISALSLDRQSGFLDGTATISGNAAVTIDILNEYMAAKTANTVIAEAPEIFIMLSDKRQIITSDALVLGMKVSLFRLPAPDVWCQKDHLEQLHAVWKEMKS